MITVKEIADKIKSTGKYWISFTGDSITSCEWVHPNWREVVHYVLKEELTKYLKDDWKTAGWGIRTFNFGYSGATTKDILKRVGDIGSVSPDLVISLMGGNDPTFGVSISESVDNIINIVKKLDTKVVWCSSTPANKGSHKNEEYEPYAKALMQIPKNKKLQIVNMFDIYQKFPLEKIFTFISEGNLAEGIKEGEIDPQHPNPLGNAYIAKVILKEAFGIEFDPEKYWQSTLKVVKYPEY